MINAIMVCRVAAFVRDGRSGEDVTMNFYNPFTRRAMRRRDLPAPPNAFLFGISVYAEARLVRRQQTVSSQDGCAVLTLTGAGIATAVLLRCIFAVN
jgi:hypothetical protein